MKVLVPSRSSLVVAVLFFMSWQSWAAADSCSCHYGVEKSQTVESGSSIGCTVEAVVTLDEGQPVRYPLTKGEEKDLGLYCAHQSVKVEFVVTITDHDDNVCEPGEDDALAKVAAKTGADPLVKVRNAQHTDLSLDRDNTVSWGLWAKQWTPPSTAAGIQPGVYEFRFEGRVEDLHGDHESSDDTPDVNLAGYTAKLVLLKIESIDGYVYGESGRKIGHMEARSDPANVVASGYMKFSATVAPSSISDSFYYKWTAPSGTLTDPEGLGNDHLEVKWDAPDAHEKDVVLTLEVRGSASGPAICTEQVELRTVRPYVVRVKFVDDFWDEEQQIHDGGDPEFDAIAGRTYPVCYVKHRGVQVQVDVAGEKDSDLLNNLTKRTPIRITAKAAYGGIENQFDEDSMDADTEEWLVEDYGTIEIESDDNLPDKVTEYEDFEMHWTVKVKNSSGNWIVAYMEEPAYSQKTIHKESAGAKTYGLYTIFDVYKCADVDFTKSHIDDAVGWATPIANPTEAKIASAVNDNAPQFQSVDDGCICGLSFDEVWNADRIGSDADGMCCCRALGLVYALEVVGIGPYNQVYVNEKPEPNTGRAIYHNTCATCGAVDRCYWDGFWNNWEGSARRGGNGTMCYAPANGALTIDEGTYTQIRNAIATDCGFYWASGAAFAEHCTHLPPP